MNVLYAISYLGTAVMFGFTMDRLIWDLDSAHLGDTDALQYVSVVTFVDYGAVLVAQFLVAGMWIYYRRNTGDIAWIQLARRNCSSAQKLSSTKEWLRETQLWISANSCALNAVSLATLSFDRWWAFIGSYSSSNLSIMIALTAIILVLNTFLIHVNSMKGPREAQQ